MIKVYGIPNCNSVKKAFDWLETHHIAYEFHNYKKEGVSAEKMEEWLTQVPWEKLVNRAGTTFRKLTEEEKAAINDAASAKTYLLSQNSAIKRPLIEQGEKVVLLGFDEAKYNDFFL